MYSGFNLDEVDYNSYSLMYEGRYQNKQRLSNSTEL